MVETTDLPIIQTISYGRRKGLNPLIKLVVAAVVVGVYFVRPWWA